MVRTDSVTLREAMHVAAGNPLRQVAGIPPSPATNPGPAPTLPGAGLFCACVPAAGGAARPSPTNGTSP